MVQHRRLQDGHLRTVPTIVIAHTFCLSVMLTNTGIFLLGLKLSGESRS